MLLTFGTAWWGRIYGINKWNFYGLRVCGGEALYDSPSAFVRFGTHRMFCLIPAFPKNFGRIYGWRIYLMLHIHMLPMANGAR